MLNNNQVNKSLRTIAIGIVIAGVLFSIHSLGQNRVKDARPSSNTLPALDYQQRQRNIHSHILHIFPGTYLDSMTIAIHLFSDSIRMEIVKAKPDSISYFKDCLNGSLKDSILLNRLSKISTEKEQESPTLKGFFSSRCMDASNSSAVDSVAMDVFSGNSLTASGFSDKLGIVQLHGIPAGNYSVVFSRRGYAPLSLNHIKVSNTGQTSIDVMMNKRNGYLIKIFLENIWVSIAGIIVLLMLASFLTYSITKRKTGAGQAIK